MAKISMGTLYDANKQLMTSNAFKPLTHDKILEAQKKI